MTTLCNIMILKPRRFLCRKAASKWHYCEGKMEGVVRRSWTQRVQLLLTTPSFLYLITHVISTAGRNLPHGINHKRILPHLWNIPTFLRSLVAFVERNHYHSPLLIPRSSPLNYRLARDYCELSHIDFLKSQIIIKKAFCNTLSVNQLHRWD